MKTEPTVEELRQWAAEELMEWFYNPTTDEYFTKTGSKPALPYINDGQSRRMISWRPDEPETGQIWMVVEKLRERGFYINHVNGLTHHSVFFLKYVETQMSPSMGHFNRAGETVSDTNPCYAILKAAWAVYHSQENK